MGIFSSKEKESDATKPSGYQNQNKPLFSTKSFFDTSKHKMKAEIYAEIIPGKTLPAAVPPLKIIINQHVANAAIDSIRDSQQLADELSKGLIIDLLVHPQTPNQFGTLLKYTFAYEDILLPTRDLLFWSLKLPHIQQHLFMQTRTNLNWWLANYGKTALYPLATQWILNPETRTSLIVPLLQYTCRDPENVMTPLAVLIAEAIPYAKDSTVEGIKYYVTETLKSDEAKKTVKDALVFYLRKVGNERVKDKDKNARHIPLSSDGDGEESSDNTTTTATTVQDGSGSDDATSV